MVRIALADDHTVVRQGLRALLSAEQGFSVVGEAGDGLEAIELVRRKKPQVLVLDLKMRELNGLEVIPRVRELKYRTRVVVLSMYASVQYAHRALQLGAAAFVNKDATAGQLVQAVRAVMAGEVYLSPPLSEQAVEQYARRISESETDPCRGLTGREREVLRLAANGLSCSEVAGLLRISVRTAEAHRRNLMHKLCLHSQTELVRYALEKGLVPVFDSRPSES